jgi:hypothetical protein
LGCANIASKLTGYATDASGFFADISRSTIGSTNGTIVLGPDGTKFSFVSSSTLDSSGNLTTQNPTLTDPNGNQITSTTFSSLNETDWTDSLGQTVLKIVNVANASQISETDYKRLAVDRTYQTIAMKYEISERSDEFWMLWNLGILGYWSQVCLRNRFA